MINRPAVLVRPRLMFIIGFVFGMVIASIACETKAILENL